MMQLRNYDASNAGDSISGKSAFNVPGYTTRRKLNQYATIYEFPDRSRLLVKNSGLWKSWHPDWRGTHSDIHLGPSGGTHNARVST